MLIAAVADSTLVQVDEKGERVRPQQKRNTVILREIPGSTPKEVTVVCKHPSAYLMCMHLMLTLTSRRPRVLPLVRH